MAYGLKVSSCHPLSGLDKYHCWGNNFNFSPCMSQIQLGNIKQHWDGADPKRQNADVGPIVWNDPIQLWAVKE